MTLPTSQRSRMRWARLAGGMYLFVDAAYATGLLVGARFRVAGDLAETARRILASEHLFRIGLASTLLGALCTVLLAMGLYGAVKPVDDDLALLALGFRLVEATLFGVQSMFAFGALRLYRDVDSVWSLSGAQLAALMKIRAAAAWDAFDVAAIFFGMGSVLFFYLFLRSRSIPRGLAVLGLGGSMLVPLVCLATLVAPEYDSLLRVGWLPVGIAEVLVGLWLLVKGVRIRPPDELAPEAVRV